MSTAVTDPVDAIMAVMDEAFDPAFGEAWNRRQVSDALILANSHYLLADASGGDPADLADTVGFLLSRHGADEEELLLLAVRPAMRRCGVASALLARFANNAAERRVERLFLQMRDGNAAEKLYRANGFSPIGRRREYYRRSDGSRIDAITFTRRV